MICINTFIACKYTRFFQVIRFAKTLYGALEVCTDYVLIELIADALGRYSSFTRAFECSLSVYYYEGS